MNSVKKLILKNFVVSSCRGISSTSTLLSSKDLGKKTALFDFHVAHGGKVVNFAGYLLPVQYSDQGIAQSHLHTRSTRSASIFDVSHMLQTYVTGKDALECIESITTADIQGLAKGSGSLTVFTNENGGILDDLIVNRVNSKFLYVVSNAAMKDQDSQLIREAIDRFRGKGKEVDVKFFSPKEKSLLAFQGPAAQKVLQKLTKINLSELYFMTTKEATVAGIENCRITRCGYTGEDGFEISIPSDNAKFITEALLESKEGNVKMAGLGPRDSLRLEAGLCLYGSDIDQTTTPIEAGLAWLVAKRRRAAQDFPGSKIILAQLKNGCSKRRVGFKLESGPPARHDVEVYSNGISIGKITSGCPAPSLGNANIAMGYIKEEFKKPGTEVELKIREKFYKAQVTKMPFVLSNYYQKPK